VVTELVLGVVALMLPVAMVVLTLPRWSERQVTARAVTREVARRAARDGVCDEDAARDRAAEMARDLGVPPGQLSVELRCPEGASLPPGSDVEVQVTVEMPAVQLPLVGAVGAWSWTAGHREPVDFYVAAR
jgi:hypothetical protein